MIRTICTKPVCRHSLLLNSSNAFYVALVILLTSIGIAAQSTSQFTLLRPLDGATVPDTRSTDDPSISHTGDSSIPYPTVLEWEFVGCNCTPNYSVYLAEDTSFNDSDLIAENITADTVNVWNLKIAATYFWKVVVKDTSRTLYESPVYSFSTPDLWPRMLFIDGITNVRDIGGRTVQNGRQIRQGLFYRSSELSYDQTVTEYGIRQLMDLGITTEIDLRNDDEDPDTALPPSIRYFRPFADEVGGVKEFWDGLKNYSIQYGAVFKELAKQETYPVLCHCKAGADRTGTVAALLEALIGCSLEQIVLDFEWTSLSINGPRDAMITSWQDMISGLRSYDSLNGTLQVGAWNYLVAAGVTPEELDSIKSIFLAGEVQHVQEKRVVHLLNNMNGSAKLYNPLCGFSEECIFSKGKNLQVHNLLGRLVWRHKIESDKSYVNRMLPMVRESRQNQYILSVEMQQ